MNDTKQFFALEGQSEQARAGRIITTHGEIETPIFMPVGTRASVKTMFQDDLEEIGSQIILGNTYHLYLRPGHQLIERMGGLHKFMSWNRPILTDSGGYQVFSLADINKLSEEGVRFQSHIDGSYHMITPEKSMEIQRALGSDIVMAFDECPALPATKKALEDSVNLTLRWAKRCKEVELKKHQFLFGIVQGGLHQDLRSYCMEELEKMNFPGLALGGLSVGEKNQQMVDFLHEFTPKMPAHRPRYLMGVGKPLDILNAIRSGIDMFDCVLPTRNARNGQVFTFHGPMNIKNERFKEDESPLDPHFENAMSRYTRSYIRHLFTAGEYLAGQIISYHNLSFFLELVKRSRKAILAGEFESFYQQTVKDYSSQRWKA